MGGLRRGGTTRPHGQNLYCTVISIWFRIPVLANMDTGTILFATEKFVASSTYRSSSYAGFADGGYDLPLLAIKTLEVSYTV